MCYPSPMPALTPVLEIDAADAETLGHQLAGLHAWRRISQSQRDAIMQNLLPILPCDVTIAQRSPLSIVYVTAGATRFRIERGGKMNLKPWNPNPRRYVNPWT